MNNLNTLEKYYRNFENIYTPLQRSIDQLDRFNTVANAYNNTIQSENFTSAIEKVHRSTRYINNFTSKPAYITAMESVQSVYEMAYTPAINILKESNQFFDTISNSLALKKISIANQRINAMSITPTFKRYQNVLQSVNSSIYKATTVETIENIVSLNQNLSKFNTKIFDSVAYKIMISNITKNLNVPDAFNVKLLDSANQVITSFNNNFKEIQNSMTDLEKILENPYEEIISDDIDEYLNEHTLYEIVLDSKNTINNIEKNSDDEEYKALWTKKDVMKIFILFLLAPYTQLLKDVYADFTHEYILTPTVHVINDIKKEFRSNQDSSKKYAHFSVVTTENLAIKKGTRIDSETIGFIRIGEIVEVVDKKRNWTKIKLKNYNNEFIEGWVFTRYLDKIN